MNLVHMFIMSLEKRYDLVSNLNLIKKQEVYEWAILR